MGLAAVGVTIGQWAGLFLFIFVHMPSGNMGMDSLCIEW